MRTTIRIEKPCHQNWENMAAADKGRFCQSCQQKVYDLTQSSDRQIALILKSDKNACGRFLQTQLNRKLIVPKQKSPIWTAGFAGILTLLSLGDKVYAQTIKPTQQVETRQYELGKFAYVPESNIQVSGNVIDEQGQTMPFVKVTNKRTSEITQTDIDGNFSIVCLPDDQLVFKSVEFDTVQQTAVAQMKVMMRSHSNIDLVDGYFIRPERSFFGKIFHRIGKWFR